MTLAPSPDREDLTKQHAAISDARETLAVVLGELAGEAAIAAKTARRKTNNIPDIDPVTAVFRRVQQAEEALDLAVLDLATASGQDA